MLTGNQKRLLKDLVLVECLEHFAILMQSKQGRIDKYECEKMLDRCIAALGTPTANDIHEIKQQAKDARVA